MAVVK